MYFRLGDIEKTLETCERALAINSRELTYYLDIGDLYEKTNQHEKAIEVLSRGLNLFPDDSPLQIMAAKSARRLGKNEESLERLNSLSQQETSMPPDWRIKYHFELGFIHDKNLDADKAFKHFTRANELIRSQPVFRKVDTDHSLNLIRDIGQLDFDHVRQIIEISRKKPPRILPIFFVGFPRSGTTLLEKVLDSHHNINVIEEDNPLGQVTAMFEQDPEKYLRSDFLLKTKNIQTLRDKYFNEAKKYAPVDDGSMLVDKLPMNIVQIHVIKILFPEAKILLGLRHPCDSILSSFMQSFGVNRAMANMFEFESVINYYDCTMRLWQTFKSEIHFESHSVRYEDLIENMEKEVSELLDFLGLKWDEEVLNYRQNVFNRGFINTPSYSQVVRPIYKEARYRWHRYAEYFKPHLQVLKPHCDAFGYSLKVE